MTEFGRKFEELDVNDDAAIGRAIRAFGLLEYSLGRLVIRLFETQDSGEYRDPSSKEAKDLSRLMGGSLGDHAKCWDSYREQIAKVGAIKPNDVDGLSERLKDLGKWRNIICHGIWARVQDDKLFVTFWSRDATKLLRENFPTHDVMPDQETVTRQDLREIVNELICLNSAILHLIDRFEVTANGVSSISA